MATDTPNHGFPRPEYRTTNWHTIMSAFMDKLDLRMPNSYAGNPNTNVAGQYVGQPMFDRTNSKLYICTTVGDASTAVWQEQSGFPTGGIIMWSGTIATIPTGWALCNGSNGTPDLRDRFIIGARSDDAGVAKTNVTGSLTSTGGAATAVSDSQGAHTHSGTTDSSNVTLPAHTHGLSGVTISSSGAHTHTTPSLTGSGFGGSGLSNGAGGAASTVYNTGSDGAHSHTLSGSTDSTGSGSGAHTHTFNTASGGAHTHTTSTLSPYYALAFIMKV